eukprot:5549089-Alexandrium_andersonii.AAC.1
MSGNRLHRLGEHAGEVVVSRVSLLNCTNSINPERVQDVGTPSGSPTKLWLSSRSRLQPGRGDVATMQRTPAPMPASVPPSRWPVQPRLEGRAETGQGGGGVRGQPGAQGAASVLQPMGAQARRPGCTAMELVGTVAAC